MLIEPNLLEEELVQLEASFAARSIVVLYSNYIKHCKEQAKHTLPSSPPSFEGFMHYLTTLYEA